MAEYFVGEIKDNQDMKVHLSSDAQAACYLLFGGEIYLKELYLTRLKKKYADGEMNIYTFRGAFDPEDVRDVIDGISLFGERKLVLIRDSGFFNASRELDFLDNAGDSGTTVVFVEDSADRRTATFKNFLKKGAVFECKAATESDIRKLLGAEARAAGRQLTPGAADVMLEGIGTDITELRNELEKLILYVPDGAQITETDVRKVCELSLSARIFDLTDAVVRGDRAGGLKILEALLAEKESPLGILSMIGRAWSNLYKVKLLLSEGASQSDIQRRTGQKPYPVKKQCEQARRFSLEEIERELKLVLDMDLAVKTGEITDRLALELVVLGG